MTSRRLYLDTGDLLRIADGRVEPGIVEALRGAMEESGTRLVLTREHIQDALSNVDSHTFERFVRAVEGFLPVLMVLDGPWVVEPLVEGRGDIVCQPCSNFRELVSSGAMDTWLARGNALQDQTHSGTVAAQTVLRGTAPTQRVASKSAEQIFSQAFVTLCRGWLGEEVGPIIAFWEQELGLTLAPNDRPAVVARLEAAREVLAALRGTIEREGVDMTEVLRNLGAAGTDPRAYPGQFLALRLSAARLRDLKRTPLRSDLLDVEHAAHFPYVDTATCDGHTFHLVTRAISGCVGPRLPVITRTTDLASVVDFVRRAGDQRGCGS